MKKRERHTRIVALSFCAFFCMNVSIALAHGVISGPSSAKAFTVQFSYADGTPMAYASALVYGPPLSEKVPNEPEYQNGRTDALGHFAFVPDRAGKWKVEATEMGHRGVVEVEITKTGMLLAAQQEISTQPQTTSALLGLSILANLLAGAYFLQFKRTGKRQK